MIHAKCGWCGQCIEVMRPGDRYHDQCIAFRLFEELYDSGPRKRLNGAVRVYGLTADEYLQILEDQEYRCAICRHQPSGLTGKSGGNFKRFHVDHDHNTLAVRGLLCYGCNSELLPAAKNDADVLERAAEYLRRDPVHRGKMVPDSEEKD